jgi:Putative Ig domain
MANNVTVNFTTAIAATDPLGLGFVCSEFGGNPVPMVADNTWYTKLKNLAPGHVRCSIAWYGGNPGYGAGGSSRTPGTATPLINAIKSMGAIPLVSFNGDSADNNFFPNDGGNLVHYFNDNGGQNGGPIHYWSIGNEAENAGQASINTYEAGTGTGNQQGSAVQTANAMWNASNGINIGAPAASYWDTSFVGWAAANMPHLGGLSYHAYDGSNTNGTGFPTDGQYYTHIHSDLPGMKAGVLYGVEEINWNGQGYDGSANWYDWVNCNYLADAAGQIMSAGGHMTIYSDSGTSFGLMNDGSGNNNQPGAKYTTFPAYWAIGIWTGMNGQFKRYSGHFVSCSNTFTGRTVTSYACDNNKIVICNNGGSNQNLSIGLTLAGGLTSGTYNVWATNAATATNPITKVVSGAAFSGSTITYTIPAQTVVSIDITPGTGGGNTVTVNNPGSQSSVAGTAIAALQMTATDSQAGQTFTWTQTGLPTGLSINSSTGQITGTPTASGTYTVNVTATDTTSASGSTSFVWTINPAAGNTVTVTNPGNQTGVNGTAISTLQIHATDSASGQTLTYTQTGLPTGLSINSSTGAITGTPTVTNTFNVVVTATDTTTASGSAAFTWTISPSGGPGTTVSLINDFREGTAGTGITTGNSGGTAENAFDAVTATNGATVTYSATQAIHSSLSMAVTTTATAGVASATWSTSLGTQTTVFGRAYLYLTASPAVTDAIFQHHLSGATTCNIQMTTGRQIAIQDANSATVHTLTSVVPTGQWVRVEWEIIFSATVGQVTVNYYASADSTTTTETYTSAATQNFNTGANSIDWGWTNSHASQPVMYMANLNINNTGFAGPANSNVLLVNNFDGLPNPGFITPANSGSSTANAFDGIIGTPASTNQPAHGKLGGAFSTNTITTQDAIYWSTSLGIQPVVYGRIYVFLNAYPAVDDTFIQFINSGTFGGGIMFTAAGALGIQSAGFSEFFNGITLPLNQYFRLEWKVICGAAGSASCTVNYYSSMDSTTITATVTDATGQYGSGGVMNQVNFGWNTSHPNQPLTWVDDVGLATTGYMGPAGHPSTGALAIQSPAFSGTSTGTTTNNLLYNNFEGGTNGTTITTGNSGGSSGHAWDVATVTNGSLVYSNTQAAHGGLSGAMSTNNTGGVAYIGWTTSLGTVTSLYGRFNIYLTAYPTTVDANVQMKGTGSSSAGNVQIDTTGHIIAQTNTFTNAFAFVNAIPLNQWVRVEWYLLGGSAGNAQFTINYYASLDSTQITETHTDTTFAWGGTGGTIDEMDFGWTNTHANQPTIYMDDLAMSPVQFLGPAGINGSSVLSLQPFQFSGTAVDTAAVKTETATGSLALQPFQFSGNAADSGLLFIQNIVEGNVVNDYGLDNVPYTMVHPGTNSGLLAYIGWDIAQLPYQSSGHAPAVNVTDSAGNLWRQLGISTMSTSARAAIWMADNPRQTQWVSVALTGWAYSTSYMIMELNNMSPSTGAVALDFVKTINNTSPTTTLTISATPSTTDIVLGCVANGGASGAFTVPSGWTGLAAVGGSLPAETTTYATWIPNTASTVTFNPTWANSTPTSAVVVGLKRTAPAPVQSNPSMPVVVVEAAFGAIPGDWTRSVDYTFDNNGVVWTDISSRCFSKGDDTTINVKRGRQYELSQEETGEISILLDNHDGVFTYGNTASPYYNMNVNRGWSFTVSGTPVSANYFIIPTTQAGSVNTGDVFNTTAVTGGPFTVTTFTTGAGFTNCFFTPNANTGINNPAVVSQLDVNLVRPGVPIRVTAWFNGIQYPVAFGYVERWPQEWPDMPQWGFSTLTAVDAFGPLASTDLPSAVEGDIRKDYPYAYFPTDEQYSFTTQSLTPSAAPLDSNGLIAVNKAPGNSRVAAYRDGFDQPVTVGQPLNLLGDQDTTLGSATYSGQEINDNGPGMFYFDPNIPTNANSQGATYEFWFSWGNTNLFSCTLMSAWGRASSYWAPNTSPTAGGVITVGINTGNNTGSTAVTSGFYVNGVAVDGGSFNQTTFAPQHFVMSIGPGGTSCYLNGVQTVTHPTMQVLPQIRALTLGPARFSYDVSDIVVYNGFNFVAGHLAVYPYNLTGTQIANHYTSGINGFSGISASGRFAQVLTWGRLGLKRGGTAWFQRYGITEGTYISEAYSYEGSTGADVMNQLTQTEGGRCYSQANGSIVYVYRWYLYNQGIQATFGDAAGELPFENDTTFSVDNSFIYNQVTGTQTRGPNQDFYVFNTNFPSQASFFNRSGLTYQSYAMTPFDVFDRVNWSASKYAQPMQRVISVRIDPSSSQGKNPNMFPTILGLELNQNVTINRRPVGGTTISVTGTIQQISHEIGATAWHVNCQVTPTAPENNTLFADTPNQNTPANQYLSW